MGRTKAMGGVDRATVAAYTFRSVKYFCTIVNASFWNGNLTGQLILGRIFLLWADLAPSLVCASTPRR
jgi:uncharacterized membrane protein YesL